MSYVATCAGQRYVFTSPRDLRTQMEADGRSEDAFLLALDTADCEDE